MLGWSVPQRDMFYGAPSLATRLGASHVSGPMLSQACATSVALLRAATGSVLTGAAETVLAVAADRTSNGPLLVYPQPSARRRARDRALGAGVVRPRPADRPVDARHRRDRRG